MGDPEKQIALLYLLSVDKIIQMQVVELGDQLGFMVI